MQEAVLLLYILLLFLVPGYQGYQTGPPNSACAAMNPNHGAGAQTSEVPYNITISSSSYETDQNITVTIVATGNSAFKGFFIQARSSSSDSPVGQFHIIDGDSEVQLMTCSGGGYSDNSVAHTSSVEKTSKQFVWHNPDGGNVTFLGTFVNVKTIFWTNVRSTTLIVTTSQDTSSTDGEESTNSTTGTDDSDEGTNGTTGTDESDGDTNCTTGTDESEGGTNNTMCTGDDNNSTSTEESTTVINQSGTTGSDLNDDKSGTIANRIFLTAGIFALFVVSCHIYL